MEVLMGHVVPRIAVMKSVMPKGVEHMKSTLTVSAVVEL
jgi:hypothetical protein